MKKETLDKIEQLAEFIIREDRLKKRIMDLNKANKVYQVRDIIISLIKSNHQKREEKELIKLKDYVTLIFPDGISGREIRDLLLISIYQKMHEQSIFFDEPIAENNEDETPIEELI